MNKLRGLCKRFLEMFRGSHRDAELAAELESHLQFHIEDNLRAGMTAGEARRQALIRLGGVDQTKEAVRDRRGFSWLETLFRDVRFGMRILRKNWKVAAVSIFSLSIAMAIGVLSLGVSNTAILAPPAGVAPDRLVMIHGHSPGKAIDNISYPDYEYYRQNNHAFTDIAAIPQAVSVGVWIEEGRKQTLISSPVSENYFSVLGIRPYLGRFFLAGDGNAKPPVAVMSYSRWVRMGSDPNIAGKTVGQWTIVGVAPKEFTGNLYGINGDLLLPMGPQETSNRRDDRNLMLLARLNPSVTRSQAQADLATLSAQLATAYPKDDKDRAAILTRATLLPPDAIPTAELVAAILLLLVVLVLLIACANVANLLLALAVGRRRETAVKMALGATRSRLIREFLTESAVVCAGSGLLGYALAVAAIRRYSSFTVNLPEVGAASFALKFHLGLPVLAGTLALGLIAVLATGFPAALYASSPNPARILGGETGTSTRRRVFRRDALIIVQIAICTLVLVGMGLCERSLYNLRHVDFGFSARNLVDEKLFMQGEGFTEAKGKQLYGEVRRAVSAIPGVQAVTLAAALPLLDDGYSAPVQLPGGAKPESIASTVVDSNYFATFGIPILSGRVFTDADTSPSEDVLVVNRRMAESLWPGGDAIGHVVLTGDSLRRGVIVGVVGDGKYGAIDEEPQPHFYYALSQHYQAEVDVFARTAGDPTRWLEPVADTVKRMGFQSPIQPFTFQTLENVALFPQRVAAGCVAAFSGLGLLLAVVGLFGAISYLVSERKKELGIRVALGAQRRDLLAMILRQTGSITGVGTLIGLLMGIAATMLTRSQLFGIAALEWSVLVPVAAAMLAVCLTVAGCSAWPWIKADPARSLRQE